MTEKTQTQFSQDPSSRAGDMPREDDLHEVMARATSLFEMDDEEFEKAVPDFVVERMSALSEGASTDFMSIETKGTKDFIVPERPQQIMGIGKSFLMDDPELYVKQLTWVRHQLKELKSQRPDFPEEKAYVNAAIRGTLIGQWAYFGSYVGDRSALFQASADILDDDDEVMPEHISIADIGTGAICHQRAASVHNSLRILGIDSAFETADLAEVVDGTADEPERHAYIVITHDGKRILYDPTNPILNKKENGEVTWLSPKLMVIPEGTSEMDAQLPEIITAEDGTKQTRTAHTLRYTFN